MVPYRWPRRHDQSSTARTRGTGGGSARCPAFLDQPQQRIRTARHGQPLGQAHTSLAAQGQPEVALKLAQPLGSLCEGLGGIGQRLGKGLPGAGRIETAETARLYAQRDRLPLPRQIMKHAPIPAMDVLGNHGTTRARRRLLTKIGNDDDLIGSVQDVIDHKAGRDERQKAFGQEGLSITLRPSHVRSAVEKSESSSTQVAGEP
jgi:hypothetical protein